MTTPTELLRQAREALAYLLPLAEMQPADVEPGRHLMRGDCPDETQPSSRDAECPACKKMVAADELIAAIDALPSAPAWPCYCDERGIGKPGVTCGDCPRDYGHTPASAPSGEPAGYVDSNVLGWLAAPVRGPAASVTARISKAPIGDEVTPIYRATTAPAPLPPHNGLTVKVGADGVWLAFVASTGRSALLNVERIADSHGSITGKALRDWAADVSGTAPLMANGLTESETAAAPQAAPVPAPSDCLWARNGNAPCRASTAAAAPEPVGCKHHNGQFCGRAGACLFPYCKSARPAPAPAVTATVQPLTITQVSDVRNALAGTQYDLYDFAAAIERACAAAWGVTLATPAPKEQQ